MKGAASHLLTGFNVFVLFFLLFEERIQIPAWLMTAGRMHPLVLHFPIVLLILAFCFEIFKKHLPLPKQASDWLTRLLLLTGAISAGISVVFGLFLSREDGYSGELVTWHKWAGVAVFFAASFLSAYYFRLPRPAVYATTAFTFVTLLATGHFGASLTHGENFVLEPLLRSRSHPPDLTNAQVYGDLVKPVLQTKCFSCHNPDKAKGSLVLTDTSAIKNGGETGDLFIAGNSGESLMIQRLLLDINDEHRMPPKGKAQLADSEIALIRAWVDAGGNFHSRIDDVSNAAQIRDLATQIYGSQPRDEYNFPAAAPDLVAALNNSYRLVAPVAYQSPGLEVSYFGRTTFTRQSLEEINKVGRQIVSLNISGMPVEDRDIETIVRFPNIEKLNLSHTAVTDVGVSRLSDLANLKLLMLSGTGATGQALSALQDLPRLKTIYAWNTAVTEEEAATLMANKKHISIEMGAEEEDSTLLQLNPLSILPDNSFFQEPFQLQLTHPIHGTTIYYTLDGTHPDSVEASIYGKPFTIDANTTVRAKAIKEGWLPGSTITKTFERSSLAPDSSSLITFPHPLYKGNGIETLFDLQDGSTDILYASDGKWLGYHGQDFIAELVFTTPVQITEITLSSLISTNLEAFPPTHVEISVIEPDGRAVPLTAVNPVIPAKNSSASKNMIRLPLKAAHSVQKLRVVARPVMKMPSWHAQSGKPAWFFIDEILIN